jgi:hypothetical protein
MKTVLGQARTARKNNGQLWHPLLVIVFTSLHTCDVVGSILGEIESSGEWCWPSVGPRNIPLEPSIDTDLWLPTELQILWLKVDTDYYFIITCQLPPHALALFACSLWENPVPRPNLPRNHKTAVMPRIHYVDQFVMLELNNAIACRRTFSYRDMEKS